MYRPVLSWECLDSIRRLHGGLPLQVIAGSVAGSADYGEGAGCNDRLVSMLERNFVTAPTLLGPA
jgi:hypothetical protein